MSNQPRLNIAIIADDPLALHHIKALLAEAEYGLSTAILAENVDRGLLNCVADVWLIELKADSDVDWLGDLYSLVNIPILMGDGVPSQREAERFICWRKRILKKLESLAPKPVETEVTSTAPTFDHENPIISQAHYNARAQSKPIEYWVLAASMGGVEAVKTFLDGIRTDLPVCLIYAQHTNDQQGEILAQVLMRNNNLPIRTLIGTGELEAGEVVIVPTEHQVTINANAEFESIDSAWPAPYAPSIDQVLHNIASQYCELSGVIMFSGMCNDGASGALYLHQQGGLVWAQSPDCCVSADMPNAVIEQDIVSFTGTPEELAERFMQHIDTTPN